MLVISGLPRHCLGAGTLGAIPRSPSHVPIPPHAGHRAHNGMVTADFGGKSTPSCACDPANCTGRCTADPLCGRRHRRLNPSAPVALASPTRGSTYSAWHRLDFAGSEGRIFATRIGDLLLDRRDAYLAYWQQAEEKKRADAAAIGSLAPLSTAIVPGVVERGGDNLYGTACDTTDQMAIPSDRHSVALITKAAA